MHHSSPVTLRKIAPEANMHRQYTVAVTLDLFGTPLVTCRWGRIGTAGQTRQYVCATLEGAEQLAARVLEAKKRRGYGTGQGIAAVRPALARKLAASLRRQAACTRQLWLFDTAATLSPVRRTAAEPPKSTPPRCALPEHLVDLSTVTQQRQALLPDADRNHWLQMVMTLASKRSLSLGAGLPAVSVYAS